MEKSKRKRGEDGGLLSWVRSIYEPQRFDFESPLTLEECFNRLKALNDYHRVMWIFEFGKTRVDLVTLDSGNYQFTVRRRSGRHYVLETRGYLHGQPGMTTAVMGETRIPQALPLAMFFGFMGVFFALIAVMTRNPIGLWFFPLVWGIIMLFTLLYWVAKREQLTGEIKSALMTAEYPSFF